MTETRKITVEVPIHLLESAQNATGRGISDTVREGLELLARKKAYQRLRELRGKVQFKYSYEEMRRDED